MSYNSNIRYLGIGIVAEDKNTNSKAILVYPVEHLPFIEGDVTGEVVNVDRKVSNLSGIITNTTLQKRSSVKALWEGEDNRATSPCVVKGEQVKLYEIHDTGEYLWKAIGRDSQLRRQEAVTWAYGADSASKATDVPNTSKNSYSVTVDGVNGHMTASTSLGNNEKASYVTQMNGKDGHFTLADNLGNIVQIDSTTNTITVVNGAGSIVSVSGKAITAIAADFINLNADAINVVGTTALNFTSTITTFEGQVIFKNPVTFEDTVNVTGVTTVGTLDATTINVGTLNATTISGSSGGPSSSGITTGDGTTLSDLVI